MNNHEYEAHKKLRRKLHKFKWSVAELEWLQAHAKGWPASLESLLHAKLAEARKGTAHAKDQAL